MSRKVALAITMFLAAGSAWAQGPAPAAPPPVMAPDGNSTTSVISRFSRNRNVDSAEDRLAARERMREIESTLNSMHALLKDMQAKNASNASQDPVAKANLEMWELLLGHPDKEFHQLQIATAARDEVEARRPSVYHQAYEKAANEAQAATGAMTGQTPPARPAPAAPRRDQPKE